MRFKCSCHKCSSIDDFRFLWRIQLIPKNSKEKSRKKYICIWLFWLFDCMLYSEWNNHLLMFHDPYHRWDGRRFHVGKTNRIPLTSLDPPTKKNIVLSFPFVFGELNWISFVAFKEDKLHTYETRDEKRRKQIENNKNTNQKKERNWKRETATESNNRAWINTVS